MRKRIQENENTTDITEESVSESESETTTDIREKTKKEVEQLSFSTWSQRKHTPAYLSQGALVNTKLDRETTVTEVFFDEVIDIYSKQTLN